MVPMIAARPSNNSATPPIPINETKTKPSHLGPSGVSSSGQDSDNPAAEEPFDKPPVPSTKMNGDGNKTHTMTGQQPQPHAPMKGRKPEFVAPPQSSSKSAQVTSSLLIQPNNVCKVIKGEIHNVLNVMRTDPRYVSPLRFVEEIPTDEQHPLLLQLRELHHTLSEWELVHHESQPKAELYLTPFCDAIKGRDISATVTGAALHAIQKFLLYGFLAAEGPDAFKMIANTLLLCTFEESGAASEGETRRRNTANQGANAQDDEQVVLKLLELSALVVRCASLELEPDIIVGLLDTCLHVSHRAKRASTLLKSAASDALGQIVLEVFSQSNLTEARVAILSKLASLLNPQKNSDAYVVNSLTLVNIALETLTDELTENEIVILQNDMCKFLLSWSTTHDLVILSLTMRVIFNLFQTIRNHLKVPLEVFLTSVHLRILEHSSSQEEREVALESLLEFCQEPALMKDLYLNYDCDVNCTNLYASICATLGKVAAPPSFSGGVSVEMHQSLVDPKMNGTNHSSTHSSNNTIAQKAAAAAAEIPLNALNVLAFEGLLTTMESIARRVKGASKDPSLDRTFSSTHSSDSIDEELLAEQMSEEELQERKKQKAAFSKIAEAFNKNPNEKGWIRRGKDLGVPLDKPEDVAAMLFKAPGLQKDKLGAYLGQGPMEVHPFEHKVRLAFVEHFDFTEEPNCASALRIFLHKFRMPGEAQCIDRFMEAFSQEFYKQQGAASVLKSSDAVFVLAFSTIMLNTDLHNASNKNPRMTCEQFIRNNRGINDGEDLPDDMLTELYNQISENELQVQTEIGEFISHSEAVFDVEHFRSAWGDLLSKNVAAASFTPTEEAWKTMNQVGVHEKDMFLVIAKPALKAISSAFVRSWDDGCILDALKGLEQMARISTYFGLDKILNDIMAFLLSQGREFIIGCISLEFHGIVSGAPISQAPEDDETMSIVDPDSPIPQALMRVREMDGVDPKRIDISGAAAYRGLLALNMGLKIVRTLFPKVRSAWPQLIEVICSLRDARALPPGLADLDDFADSDGNVLPLSRSARASQKKLDEYYKSKAGREDTDRKGWFKMSLFGRKGKGPADGLERRSLSSKQNGQGHGQLTANQKTLLQVAKRVELDKIIVLTQMKLPLVKQCVKGMLEAVDKIPSTYSPTYEQHTSFALELATRALLANRERSIELLPFFLPKFEAVAAKVGKYENEQVMYPFLVERVIVTILRTSIHLFQVPQIRPQLRASLFLLPKFPKDTFIGHIADRMACGLAIILRSSFYLFKAPEDWKFFGDIFDILASYKIGRGLTFDGIASTIEFAVPQLESEDIEEYEVKLKEKPSLSLHATAAMQRVLFKYVYGSYQKDFSLTVPAMICVEKTYKHMVQLTLIRQNNEDPDADLDSVPDKELWHRVAVALYSVCDSPDSDISKQGLEACQRHLMEIFMEEIPDSKWIAVLKSMTKKQPPVQAEVSRVNTMSLLGQLIIRLFPIMTAREDNWKVLTEVTKQVVVIADENMQSSEKGKPLFDYTVKIVANIVRQMASPDFGGEKRYCKWASETFEKALEKNGAVGEAAKGKVERK